MLSATAFKAQKKSRAGEKDAIKLVAILEPMMKKLNEAIPVRSMDLDRDQRALIKPFSLITAKPVLYVANVIEGGFENNPLLDAVKAHAAKEGAPVVAICAKIGADSPYCRSLDRSPVGGYSDES